MDGSNALLDSLVRDREIPEFVDEEARAEVVREVQAAIESDLESLRIGIAEDDEELTAQAQVCIADGATMVERLHRVVTVNLGEQAATVQEGHELPSDLAALLVGKIFDESREEVMPDPRDARASLLNAVLAKRLADSDYEGYLALLDEDNHKAGDYEPPDDESISSYQKIKLREERMLLKERYQGPDHFTDRYQDLVRVLVEEKEYEVLLRTIRQAGDAAGVYTSPDDIGDFAFELLKAKVEEGSDEAYETALALDELIRNHERGNCLQKAYEKKDTEDPDAFFPRSHHDYYRRDYRQELFEIDMEQGNLERAFKITVNREQEIDPESDWRYANEKFLEGHHRRILAEAETRLRAAGALTVEWPENDEAGPAHAARLLDIAEAGAEAEAADVSWTKTTAMPDANWIAAIQFFDGLGDDFHRDIDLVQTRRLTRFALDQLKVVEETASDD